MLHMKKRAWKQALALLIALCLVCAAAPAVRADNADSDYAAVLGPEGLTSGYAALDETAHALGEYSVPRTYILRLQDETFTVANATGGRIGSEKIINAGGASADSGSFPKGLTCDAAYLAETLGLRLTDASALTALGYSPDAAATAYYYVYFVGNSSVDLGYALLIEITPNGAISAAGAARAALGIQLDRVTGEHAADWYQSGDRYNGISTSAAGFWSDLQPVLAEAQSVYADASATAEALTAAAESLAAAIGALIPAGRANATALYEAVQNYGAYVETQFTADTWAPFAAAVADAQALLDGLFEPDGSCSAANSAARQPELDAAVQAMDTAAAGLLSSSVQESFNRFALLYRRAAEWLLAKTALDASEYTPESWAAWADARDEMAACAAAGCGTTANIRAYLNALSNASAAYYALESSAAQITVHVRVADTFSLLYPNLGLADDATTTYDGDVVLTGNKKLSGLMSAMGFDGTQKQMSSERSKGLFVYINGVMYVDRSSTSVGGWIGDSNGAAQLHDGDQVVISVVDLPAYYYYIHRVPNAPYYAYNAYLSLLRIEDADRVIEAEAGQPFEIDVSRIAGAAELETAATAAGGIDLYLSPVRTDAASAAGTPAAEKLGIRTNENGAAFLTVYTEGWYRLAVADVTEQTTGVMSVDDVYVSGGAYENLAAGDYVLLHVVPSSDDSAVRAALQAELDALYGTHEEDFYTAEEWAELTGIYTEATNAVADSELLGEAYSAQKAALSAMQTFIGGVETEHAQQLANIAFLVNGLPDDLDDFTAYYLERFLRLETILNELSVYMRGQVTLGQQAKYETLRSYYYDVKHETLDAGRKYTVRFVFDGDGEKLYTRVYRGYSVVFNESIPDRTYYEWNEDFAPMQVIPGTSIAATIYDHEVSDDNLEPELRITGITVSGADDWGATVEPTYRKEWPDNTAHYYNGYVFFTMPDHDVTIHITVGSAGGTSGEPGDEPVGLETVRNEAARQITELFNTYDGEIYSAQTWNAIVSAKNSGLAAVAAAESAEEAAAAAANAISMMLNVGRDTLYASTVLGITLPDHGDPVGRVYISLENTTYPAGNLPFEDYYSFADENVFFAGWYDLCENDTMMTAVLKALRMNGLSWLGTGGSAYTITYLSTVYVDVDGDGALDADEPKLAELNAGPESGWMGTLNDWFVNFGFDQFSYAGGGLHSGDIVSVKYSSSGLGSDLGGAFNDADTTLKALSVEGGTLSPAFDSATRVYTLIVPGGSGEIRVTPTASNKNFLVKTFLNAYDADEAYYPRTQVIPVSAGDTVYVGCGERGWPSMNNQEGQAVPYSGTKYTLYVVGGEADAIDKETELLPAAGAVTYGNYTSFMAKVAALYDRYAALTEAEQNGMTYGGKLVALYETVTAFAHVDEVKAMIAALPPESEWTEAQAEALQAVLDAYGTLSDDEKQAYMTVREGEIVEAVEAFLTPAAAILYGDANGDGVVNSRDATRILRYVAGYEVEIDLEAADANGDGTVNSRDATRILRYVAGYNVTLGKQGT